MKKIITPLLLFFSFPFFSIAQIHQDSFYAKKYANMVEIDMKGLFSNNGPGGSLLFRKKHESGNFVFVDRTRFWRLGFSINGNISKTTLDPTVVSNLYISNSNNFGLSLNIGHETLFHFGKFGLYYAYDVFPNYSYIDVSYPSSKTPCIANKFGLGVALSAGMRYFLNNRFSLNIESTPFSSNLYFEKTRYYSSPNNFLPRPYNVKQYGVSFSGIWLRTIGFSYHF
jgi:hypothetical protein